MTKFMLYSTSALQIAAPLWHDNAYHRQNSVGKASMLQSVFCAHAGISVLQKL